MPTLTLPHRFEPRAYQLPFLRAMDRGAKRAVLVWHRRSGKDKCALNFTAKKMLERVGTYYHVLPYYAQGRKAIWDGIDKDGFRFTDHFPAELVANRNEQEMRVELKNGSAWQVIGADKIDAVVGTNPVGVVFSEYSIQRPQAWELIRPILAENGGWAVFIYTPRGMNHGWKLLQQAREAGWFSQVLTVADTRAIPEDVLEEERKQMPADLFDQEYHCKFLEGAGAFFTGIERNLWHGQMAPEYGHQYVLGVDLGKHQDYTVITPLDLSTFRVGMPERFNQLEWPFQKAKIEAAARRWNGATIRMDSTGLGDPIHDDLLAMGLPVEGYKITADVGSSHGSRRMLLTNLQLTLAQDRIRVPQWDPLVSELRSMRYELTEQGSTRLRVPEGTHDDCIFSLALACWDLPPLPLGAATGESGPLFETDYA